MRRPLVWILVLVVGALAADAGAAGGRLLLAQAESAASSRQDFEADALFWESIRDSDDPELFEAYLERFPEGTFRRLAENRLAALRADPEQEQDKPAPPKPKPEPVAEPEPDPEPQPDGPIGESQLAAALADPRSAVREAAVERALGSLTPRTAGLLLGQDDRAIRTRAFAAAWRSPDPGVRQAAYGYLSGDWVGTYVYGTGNPTRVDFELSMSFGQDGRFTASGVEPNTFGDPSASHLYASFQGQLARRGELAMRKTYDGTGGVSHSVDYQGLFDAGSLQVSGVWRLANGSGAFSMRRR